VRSLQPVVTTTTLEVSKVIPNPEIDALLDKPWQKPGSDLSDYFNYGYVLEMFFRDAVFSKPLDP